MIESLIEWAKKQRRVTRTGIKREFLTDDVTANTLYLELITRKIITAEGYIRNEKGSK